MDGKILPSDYDLNSINKDSIRSVTVLKADNDKKKVELTGKYGERALNGVLIITRKK